jgi:cell division septation protein DedD
LRRLIALTLAVAACSGDRQAEEGAHPAAAAGGTDAIALRIPRAGGTARAYIFPRLDSVAWSAGGAPAIGRVLSFDREAGLIAFTDAKGQPKRLDFRLGEVRSASKATLSGVTSANGTDIYGITPAGAVARMTPSGDWAFTPPKPAQILYPVNDGTLVIANQAGATLHLWHIRPPDEEILDSATIDGVGSGPRVQAGDRLYVSSRDALQGVTIRGLKELKKIPTKRDVAAIAPTPSGDRVFIALVGASEITVVDRYSESVTATIQLPANASDLRIDPLGQSLLAKPASGADSAWLVAIGTGKVIGSIATEWTNDLPAFAPDGTIATVRGPDIVFVNAQSLAATRTIRGGARDYWYFFNWNGFRPRAANLDQPVTFGTGDSTPATDTMIRPSTDSTPRNLPMRDAAPTMVPPMVLPPPAARVGTGFIVSFAALLNEQTARATAAEIQVDGARPRVVQTQSGGTPIFRVILGPYSTREEAERIGRESKRQYWIYEGGQ